MSSEVSLEDPESGPTLGGWNRAGEHASPRESYEEIEIHTRDGVALRAVTADPPVDVPMLGTCVFAHAMLAHKSTFGSSRRPGVASAALALGYRTIAFDFRGHGGSALPSVKADWGYDDLVRLDLPAVVDCARARQDEALPVVLVGHSLGGHTAIAAHATGRLPVDAVVGVAMNVWAEAYEPSPLRWRAKVFAARAAFRLAAKRGAIADALRALGSTGPSAALATRALGAARTDAPARFLADLERFLGAGGWTSADGADDYRAALANVTIPVANVVGERDRIVCHPASGEAFVRSTRGPQAIFRAPGAHMELVTRGTGTNAILRAIAWAVESRDRA